MSPPGKGIQRSKGCPKNFLKEMRRGGFPGPGGMGPTAEESCCIGGRGKNSGSFVEDQR